MKTYDKVIEPLRHNPELTAKAPAEEIGISAKGIQRQLSELKAEGKLRRTEPD